MKENVNTQLWLGTVVLVKCLSFRSSESFSEGRPVGLGVDLTTLCRQYGNSRFKGPFKKERLD